MTYFQSKKGIEPIMSVLLIMFVIVLTFTAISIWFNEYQGNWEVKSEISDKSSRIDLIGLKKSGSDMAELGLKAKGNQYHILSEVHIGDDECVLLNSNVVDSLTSVLLNCSLIIGESYDVKVFTETGRMFERYFTVYE